MDLRFSCSPGSSKNRWPWRRRKSQFETFEKRPLSSSGNITRTMAEATLWLTTFCFIVTISVRSIFSN
ncbi:hypothetical protein L596_012244 [Steinernema carpocapsae]|uniref:Uncharacterized protein n=1 Tax=Steinernema carpocapsae TaxID=34508 RepID=A0A4U5NWJ5_STECR|nr:hypothetical protein L596_012244 [Steinernema carpocapsae]